jgi:ribosomal peptide maturation radical SAM protein 1
MHLPHVLLVTMPLADAGLPNLAVEELAALARRHGYSCTALYGSLLLPRIVPRRFVHSNIGPAIFAPGYFGIDPEVVAGEIADAVLGLETSLGDHARETLVMDYLLSVEAASECLARCLEEIPLGRYDVVAFSVGFDAQKLPSAALARALRRREPSLPILFGGSGCDGSMGPALLEVFPEIDAVLQGDGEFTFLPAIEAATRTRDFASVPNCVYRESTGGILESSERAPRSALDDLPLPDYSEYLQQRQGSSYAGSPLILLFETSRGCWWGAKNHCLFCGLRADGLAYRSQSPTVAVANVLQLNEEFSPDILYATDGILDRRYLTEVFPVFAAARESGVPTPDLFYEIKSNMTRKEVAAMALGGVRYVQPGIESFSTNVLRGVSKGATGIQQIELLKWLQAYGILAVYGLLVGAHCETLADYEAMLSMMPSLYHLSPPQQLNKLLLDQFSPYNDDPERYGIHDIRPFAAQRATYRCDDEVLLRLCYEHDYTLHAASQDDVAEAHAKLATAVRRWRREYTRGAALFVTGGDALVISRRSGDGRLQLFTLDSFSSRIYSELAHARAVDALAANLGVPVDRVSEVVRGLERDRLVVVMDGRALALAVPAGASDETEGHTLPADRHRATTMRATQILEVPECQS